MLRAYMLSKGLEIPALGSFKERLIMDVMMRERRTSLSFAQLITSLLGRAFGISSDILTEELRQYGLTLFDEIYTSEYKKEQVQKIKFEIEDSKSDDKLMQKVDALEISNEEWKEMSQPAEETEETSKLIT